MAAAGNSLIWGLGCLEGRRQNLLSRESTCTIRLAHKSVVSVEVEIHKLARLPVFVLSWRAHSELHVMFRLRENGGTSNAVQFLMVAFSVIGLGNFSCRREQNQIDCWISQDCILANFVHLHLSRLLSCLLRQRFSFSFEEQYTKTEPDTKMALASANAISHVHLALSSQRLQSLLFKTHYRLILPYKPIYRSEYNRKCILHSSDFFGVDFTSSR